MTNRNTEPTDPKARLERAKDKFREDMLASDAFFAIVAKKLELSPQTDHANLLDFSCEPVFTVRGDRQFWAVRLGYSRTAESGSMTAKVSQYDFVKLAEYSLAQQAYQFDPELLSEIESLDLPDSDLAAEGIVNVWMTGMDMLHSDPTLPVGIDPMGGTVELLEDLQRVTQPNE